MNVFYMFMIYHDKWYIMICQLTYMFWVYSSFSSKVLYHTNWNPYHTDKNGFITHGVYHIGFSKTVKNRVITQLKNIKMKIIQKIK